jgi:hypothetical protein
MGPFILFGSDDFPKKYGRIQHIRYQGNKKPRNLYPGNPAIREEPLTHGDPLAIGLTLHPQYSIVGKQSQ